MAYAEQRASGRWTGVYRREGKRVSVGTYDTEVVALRMAERAEGTYTAEGGEFLPGVTLAEFVGSRWEHDLMPTTLDGYLYLLNRWVLPRIGHRRVGEITKTMVREEVFKPARMAGATERTQLEIKKALGSVYKRLVEDNILDTSPVRGIKITPPAAREYDLLTKDEAQRIIKCLPTEGAVLLAKFFTWTGLRIGEALDLRVNDLDTRTKTVSVRHRITRNPSKEGDRYYSAAGTKSGRSRTRRLSLSDPQMALLQEWISENRLRGTDLLFPKALVYDGRARKDMPDLGQDWGSFRIGARTYRHGTQYGYVGGGCRCEYCTAAVREYRRQQRVGRKTTSRATTKPRRSNTSGHLLGDTWRTIWRKACDDAGLGWYPRPYDLRHSNATWLLAGGTTIYEVARRLGHSNINTTMIYLKRTEEEQQKAASLMDDML